MLRTAIVTGSESGIGRAAAFALAAKRYKVGVCWNRDKAAGEAVAEEIRVKGGEAEVRHLNLADPVKAGGVLDDFVHSFGRLDALCNVAGMNVHAHTLDLAFEDYRRVMTVNTDGPFVLAQRAARQFVKQGGGGAIVNVTSVNEHTPNPNQAAYVASKHALGGLTKAMAMDLAQYGIRVNSVAPGFIATPMTMSAGADVHKIKVPRVPMLRMGDPTEVGNVIAFLCSDEASYVTGSCYTVDGGFLLANPLFGGGGLTEGMDPPLEFGPRSE